MIRICKNHSPTIDTKRSDSCIQDKESSSKVLEILKKLEEFYCTPINKEFNPEQYALCEDLIQLIVEAGLEVDKDDHIYLTQKVKSVSYWHIYREFNDEKYRSTSDDLHQIVYNNPEDDDFLYDFDVYRDEYFVEAIGFE